MQWWTRTGGGARPRTFAISNYTDASRLKQALTDLREGIPPPQRMLQAAAPAQRIAGSSQPVGAKLAANWTFRGDGLTDAIDRICDFAIAFAFIRNPATSSVLSCLVPSLGGANETALRHKRRNS
jgi:hypothetical protein